MELDHLREWIGRSESREDQITTTPVAALAATLDVEPFDIRALRELPPLWHWLYFTPLARQRDIGIDGHVRRGGFLPPVPLPRRMWAGGRLEFRQPLKLGEAITRISRIKDVKVKQGSSGSLVFVTVSHEISNAKGVAIDEEHDIVFRENPRADAPAAKAQPAPKDEMFSREVTPDPVLLFRYSALTFNAHRIHYDRTYVTEVEGYPGLIVHGPLIATLLVDVLRRHRPSLRVRRFSFRAVGPLFDIHSFSVCGTDADSGEIRLWAKNHLGNLAMEATAEVA
jgi:3-methylfumaryl-CoA hydratase